MQRVGKIFLHDIFAQLILVKNISEDFPAPARLKGGRYATLGPVAILKTLTEAAGMPCHRGRGIPVVFQCENFPQYFTGSQREIALRLQRTQNNAT